MQRQQCGGGPAWRRRAAGAEWVEKQPPLAFANTACGLVPLQRPYRKQTACRARAAADERPRCLRAAAHTPSCGARADGALSRYGLTGRHRLAAAAAAAEPPLPLTLQDTLPRQPCVAQSGASAPGPYEEI